jgi:hypothetical protein
MGLLQVNEGAGMELRESIRQGRILLPAVGGVRQSSDGVPRFIVEVEGQQREDLRRLRHGIQAKVRVLDETGCRIDVNRKEDSAFWLGRSWKHCGTAVYALWASTSKDSSTPR